MITVRDALYSVYRKGTAHFRGTAALWFRPIKIAIQIADPYVVPLLKSESVVIDGHRLVLDREDSLRLSLYQAYEPFETRVVEREVAPGQVVLDVGANIGYYTLLLARAVGERGRVFAFEPVLSNLKLLETNVELNGYQNVVLVSKAVTSRSGHAQLFLSHFCCGNHTLFVPEENSPSVLVETVSLDDFFRDFRGEVDLVKIDTEGAEGQVLRGMDSLLRANRRMKVITEFWPYGLDRSGVPADEFLDFLVERDLNLFQIDEPSRKLIRSSPRELARRFPPTRRDYTNLLCLPRGTDPVSFPSGS